MGIDNLLNLITWTFIGGTILLFLGYLLAYVPRFRRANKHLTAFKVDDTDSCSEPLKSLARGYKDLLRYDKTSEYANDIINFESISKAYKLKTTVLSSIPNILTSIGILGTFVGLSIAIINFNSVSSDSIRDSINILLQGMGTAFFTSVAGMTASSLFLLIERHWVSKLNWNIDRVCDILDQKYHVSADQIILGNALCA